MADPVNGYCTEDELRDRLTAATISTRSAEALADIITATSRDIDADTFRRFYLDTDPSTIVVDADPCSPRCYLPVDFSTVTTVKVDPSDAGVYGTTLTLGTDYLLEPLNGVHRGVAGWPTTSIRALGSSIPWGRSCNGHPAVQVTGTAGWSAVPAPVKQVCLMLAAQTFKLREAPLGVAGFGEFGVVRVRDMPVAGRMLDPYRKPWEGVA